jgi:uncharacterized membrane protein
MTSKATLAGIALAALILGVIFTSMGIGIWLYYTNQSFQPTSSHISDTPVGFVFGISENLTQEDTDFKIFLENLECRQGTVKAKIVLNIVCQELEKTNLFYNENSIFFLLQVPYKINNVTVDYYARDPEFYGGTVDYRVFNNSISLVLVEIPKKNGNFTFGESRNLAFYFEMENAFSQTTHYTYEMDVTFTNYFDKVIRREDSLYEIVTPSTTTVFRMLRDAELYIEQPDMNYTLSQIMPLPHGIHYYSDNRRYSWDVKAISTSFGSDSVILDFEHIPTKNETVTRENFMWFSLGLGIPLFISSLFEFLREKSGLSQIRVFASLKSALHRNSLNMENSKKEKKKRLSDKTRRILKLVVLYLAIVGGLLYLVYVVFSIIKTFPEYVPITNADTLLQIWITANGVILGFVGIIFAQLFSSTMDQQNTVYQRMLENKKKQREELKKIRDYLDNRRFALSMLTVLSLGFLTYSILLSMQAIATNSKFSATDVYAVQGFMFYPLVFSVLGIAVMIIALTLPLKPPLEEALER